MNWFTEHLALIAITISLLSLSLSIGSRIWLSRSQKKIQERSNGFLIPMV